MHALLFLQKYRITPSTQFILQNTRPGQESSGHESVSTAGSNSNSYPASCAEPSGSHHQGPHHAQALVSSKSAIQCTGDDCEPQVCHAVRTCLSHIERMFKAWLGSGFADHCLCIALQLQRAEHMNDATPRYILPEGTHDSTLKPQTKYVLLSRRSRSSGKIGRRSSLSDLCTSSDC
jgi:hypothetical protein